MFDYSHIDEGIRNQVRIARDAGLNTTDSGDGSKYPAMECALPYPHIFCVSTPDTFMEESHLAQRLFPDAFVQATYAPMDGMFIIEINWVCDED